MTVKAMFYVKSVQHFATAVATDVCAEVTLGAAFGSYLKGLPEDEANKDWSKYTPQGEIKIMITNPAAVEEFEPGAVYRTTFEKATA